MSLVGLEQIAEIIFPDLNIKREKVLYVDPINGDNLDASFAKDTNNFRTPYRDFNAAHGACDAPFDTIIMLPGVYSGTLTISKSINVYAMPGVQISGGFVISSPGLNINIYGHSKFISSSQTALSVSGATGTIINFEFDSMSGTRTYGIFHSSDGELYVKGNSIFCGHPMRISLGNKKVHMDIRDYIRSYNAEGCQFGKDTSNGPFPQMIGEIIINCPIIETTSNSAYRTCLTFHTGLKGSNGDDYKIVINAKEIRQSTAPLADPSWPYISSCVWIGAGDNIHIYGNMVGNECHCIANMGGGAIPHYGTFRFYGNMESNREVISSGQRVLNGNGWHSLYIEDGYLKTKGNGTSAGLIETTNNWNSIHAGTPGSMYFKNCIMYNEKVDSNIFELNQPFGINNANLYNCILYSEGSTGFAATTVQSGKTINYVNTISNKDNDTTISTNLTAGPLFSVDPNIVIPK